jgi:hypothetical protein
MQMTEEEQERQRLLAQSMRQERPDMYRSDGSVKSARGFLGPVPNQYGETMTEFSTDMEVDGKAIDIPTMVPTLTPDEIEVLKGMRSGGGWDMSDPVQRGIIIKAREHAKQRLKAGKNPFYQDDEEFQ